MRIEYSTDYRPDRPVLRIVPVEAVGYSRVQDRIADRGHLAGKLREVLVFLAVENFACRIAMQDADAGHVLEFPLGADVKSCATNAHITRAAKIISASA